jgi:hypothetical protein
MNDTTQPELTKDQQGALARVVNLCLKHRLDEEIITQAIHNARLGDNKTHIKQSQSGFITALLGYLGGSLIVAGFLIYASMIWDDLGSFGRVFLSLGSGLVCFFTGWALQTRQDYIRAVPALWLLAFGLLPTGLFVLLKEYVGGDDPVLGGVIVFGLCAAMFGLAWFRLKNDLALIIALLFGFAFLGTSYEKLSINTAGMWLPTSISITLLSTHLLRNGHDYLADKVYMLGAIALISSSYYYLGNTESEVMITGIILALIAGAYKAGFRWSVFIVTGILVILLAKHFGFCWGYRDNDILRITAALSGASVCFMGRWLDTKMQSRMAGWWYFIGAYLLFNGFMGLWYKTPYDVLFPALPAFMLYISMQVKSRALLSASILALLSFISYFSARYFADTIGWPITLIICGAVLIALCIYALKLGRKIKIESEI